jgi:beta-lactamase regulating signal transducer with metallopeptidase domain
MRSFVAATLAAVLTVSSALAAADSTPLAAGKPAGIKQAQDANDNTIWYIVGLGVVAAGIAIVASGNSNGALASGTTSTTSTTSTTKTSTTT